MAKVSLWLWVLDSNVKNHTCNSQDHLDKMDKQQKRDGTIEWVVLPFDEILDERHNREEQQTVQQNGKLKLRYPKVDLHAKYSKISEKYLKDVQELDFEEKGLFDGTIVRNYFHRTQECKKKYFQARLEDGKWVVGPHIA